MKGLLLKDFYMMRKYCRSYLFLAAFFTVFSFFAGDSLFFVFYPCLLCGVIPINLIGYDERSGWMQYSSTLPYTKVQIVSGKYLIGLMTQGAMLTVTMLAQVVRGGMSGKFYLEDHIMLLLMLVSLMTVTSSISLPFIFKLGAEKGRAAVYVMIGVVCGGSIVASSLFHSAMLIEIQANGVLPMFSIIGIGIYALSWYLSIVFYKKREV